MTEENPKPNSEFKELWDKFCAGIFLIGLLVASMPVGIWIWSAFPASFSGEVIVYPALREENSSLIPLDRTVYKPLVDSQTVIYWTPGIDDVPKKFHKCVVRDKLNWQCQDDYNYLTITMINGKIQGEQAITYLSGIRWHWMNFFGGSQKRKDLFNINR